MENVFRNQQRMLFTEFKHSCSLWMLKKINNNKYTLFCIIRQNLELATFIFKWYYWHIDFPYNLYIGLPPPPPPITRILMLAHTHTHTLGHTYMYRYMYTHVHMHTHTQVLTLACMHMYVLKLQLFTHVFSAPNMRCSRIVFVICYSKNRIYFNIYLFKL